MNICFLTDNWENIDYENDSTTHIIHESVKRGHKTAVFSNNDLAIRQSIALAHMKVFIHPEKIHASPIIFAKKAKLREELLPLNGFDVIFLRANPPINEITLNFLDTVKDNTFIVNDVDGLRRANNKIYPASFHHFASHLIPETHVSKNKEYLYQLIDQSENKKMILKPLNGYGGKGVIIIEQSAKRNIRSLLDFYINDGKNKHHIILQEYIEGAEKGDTRVIMLNGEAIGWVKRVPGKDDIRSNNSAGGSSVKHSLTQAEKEICKQIGPKLVSDGIYLAGLDIINNKIVEINVVSPGGMHIINKFNRVKLQQNILDFVENVVSEKQNSIKKKLEHRKLVQDANIKSK